MVYSLCLNSVVVFIVPKRWPSLVLIQFPLLKKHKSTTDKILESACVYLWEWRWSWLMDQGGKIGLDMWVAGLTGTRESAPNDARHKSVILVKQRTSRPRRYCYRDCLNHVNKFLEALVLFLLHLTSKFSDKSSVCNLLTVYIY